MRVTPQHAFKEDTSNVSVVDLAVFAQILRGERIEPLAQVEQPERVKTEATLTEAEFRQREQELLSWLLVDFKRASRTRKWCLRLFTLTGGLALMAGIAMMGDGSLVDLLLTPLEVLAAFAFLTMCVGTRLHSHMATLVANIPESDVRAIGPLLEALRLADMGDVPHNALKELLPQLEPGDAVLFTDAHRYALHLALDDTNTDVVVLLLKALEKIGDGRSISAVKRLANGSGRARVDPQVLRAAQHCLPLLEARSIYDTANQTLLRASTMQPERGAELLRVVEQPHEEAAQELLHPIQDKER